MGQHLISEIRNIFNPRSPLQQKSLDSAYSNSTRWLRWVCIVRCTSTGLLTRRHQPQSVSRVPKRRSSGRRSQERTPPIRVLFRCATGGRVRQKVFNRVVFQSYRARNKGMQILLSNSQAGPCRTVKQEQEEISRNHVHAFIPGSVYVLRVTMSRPLNWGLWI